MRGDELTIIMTCFNQEAYLPMAIDSVLSQVVDFPFRLIITDDCSREDKSCEVIRAYASQYETIEPIFSSERGGYLANVLRAKEKATTKYLCLLDADDYWTDPSFLRRAHDFLESHEEYAIYEANVLMITEDGKAMRPFISKKTKPGTYSKEMLLGGEHVPITQTTGMFLRNCIFSKGVPQVMKDALGTRSERSFEGDTGRFLMHLREGLAYYDDSVVGTYRLTSNGIWSGMTAAQKHIVSARINVDYYHYYGEGASYFVDRTYASLQSYLREKQNELTHLSVQGEFVSEYERLMVEDVYGFCKQHEGELHGVRQGLASKARQVVAILKA